MSDFQTLVGKALSDEGFAQRLIENPGETLKAEGIEPTQEILDALKDVDVNAVQNLAAAFGKDKAAA